MIEILDTLISELIDIWVKEEEREGRMIIEGEQRIGKNNPRGGGGREREKRIRVFLYIIRLSRFRKQGKNLPKSILNTTGD